MTYTPWLFDLAIVAILLVAFLLGRKKGLILTLCGLATYFVALFGARFLSQLLSPMIADALTPHVASWVQENAGSFLTDALDPVVNTNAAEGNGLLGKLQSLGLFDSVRDALGQQAVQSVTDAATALTHTIAQTVASVVIFILAFILILILWHLLSRLLNKVSGSLPIVRGLNRLLGGIFGLAQGLVILFFITWVLHLFGNVIPADVVEASLLLKLFMTANPISALTGI